MRGPSRRPDGTADAHLFPTRQYDLVKEFVIALLVVGVLTVLLAVVFSSPDRKALSLKAWAKAAPNDVVATATVDGAVCVSVWGGSVLSFGSSQIWSSRGRCSGPPIR